MDQNILEAIQKSLPAMQMDALKKELEKASMHDKLMSQLVECQKENSDLIAAKQDKHFQSHIDEKLLFELTSKVIKDCSIDEKTETETANIITKSVFVIGELNK